MHPIQLHPRGTKTSDGGIDFGVRAKSEERYAMTDDRWTGRDGDGLQHENLSNYEGEPKDNTGSR
jgi:hypothetical protein